MMKLMSLKQFEKKSKEALIRFITKQLRKKSRKTLARLAYNITKAKLPRLKTIKQKALPKRKTKRKIKKIVGKTYHTKNGQPYEILTSGKARFLKR